MKHKILAGVGILCVVLAVAFGIFAAIVYKDNVAMRHLDDEYFRGGYPSTESKMTTANWVIVGLSVASGATGILCMVGAVKTRPPF